MPDALPIETENERIVEPIHRLWQWSNWTSQKQVVALQYPLLGTTFMKIAGRDDRQRVFFQRINTETVTDFEVDERDNITYIRLDIPVDDVQSDGTVERRYHVETWDKATGEYRLWNVDQPWLPMQELGAPVEATPLAAFGIDFVPFVYAKFRDVGEQRGVGAVTLSIRKIWEADLIASALNQRMFRYGKPDMVLSAPSADVAARTPPPGVNEDQSAGTVDIGGETLHALPGGWQLQHMIANLDYRSALAILQDHMRELENDLPELAYYNLRELNQVSGRAVRMLLSDAIASAYEARGNAEDMLVRANQMGLSMMRSFGLTPDIGRFENGDFEHSFEHRDMIPLNEQELAETEYQQALGDAVMVNQLGYSKRFIQAKRGLTDEEINAMELEVESSGDAVGDSIMRAFDSGNLG